MEEMVKSVVAALFAAFVGESIIEFLVAPYLDLLKERINETVRVQLLRSLSATLGVFIAWEFNFALFALLGINAQHPLADIVLTGILFGRGSNWVHGMLTRFFLGVEEEKLRVEIAREK